MKSEAGADGNCALIKRLHALAYELMNREPMSGEEWPIEEGAAQSARVLRIDVIRSLLDGFDDPHDAVEALREALR